MCFGLYITQSDFNIHNAESGNIHTQPTNFTNYFFK
jgi:hypothetical protein